MLNLEDTKRDKSFIMASPAYFFQFKIMQSADGITDLHL